MKEGAEIEERFRCVLRLVTLRNAASASSKAAPPAHLRVGGLRFCLIAAVGADAEAKVAAQKKILCIWKIGEALAQQRAGGKQLAAGKQLFQS